MVNSANPKIGAKFKTSQNKRGHIQRNNKIITEAILLENMVVTNRAKKKTQNITNVKLDTYSKIQSVFYKNAGKMNSS